MSQTSELLLAGLTLAQLILGGRKRKVNDLLSNMALVVLAKDEAAAALKHLKDSARHNIGAKLSPDEVNALIQLAESVVRAVDSAEAVVSKKK